MKTINKKPNYTLFIFILVFTVVSSIILYLLYYSYKMNSKEVSAINGEVEEIMISNLTEYLNENEVVYLYFNKSSNEKRDYEIEMLRISKEKNIPIIFLDMDNISDTKSLIRRINNRYADEIKFKKYPAFILFKDNKIIKIVEENNNTMNFKEISEIFSLEDTYA